MQQPNLPPNEPSPQFFLDENADLNEMTDEIHNQRLTEALRRFWLVQAEEMVA
jgi:hypothetical protein